MFVHTPAPDLSNVKINFNRYVQNSNILAKWMCWSMKKEKKDLGLGGMNRPLGVRVGSFLIIIIWCYFFILCDISCMGTLYPNSSSQALELQVHINFTHLSSVGCICYV